MDLTTATRIKLRLGIDEDDTSQDSILGQMIARVSAEAEVLMNRHAESTSRTVQIDAHKIMRHVSLSGYPVTSITSVHNDVDRNFGSDTILAAADYYSDDDAGLLWFEVTLSPARGALQIIYTGGMATTTANFITAYPDVAEAIDQRVVQLWQRRNEVGLSSVGGGQGNISAQTIDWIPDAKAVIMSHRRLGRV